MTFGVNQLYTLDLRDDFVMNYDKDLYEFIDNDPIKAYNLGIYVTKWFNELNKDQQYLHSRCLRHINEEVLPYSEQINYWSKKFPTEEDGQVDLLEMCDYIYDNIIWLEDEDIARIKVALFLGMITGQQMKEREDDVDEHSVKNFTSSSTIIFSPNDEGEEEGDEI